MEEGQRQRRRRLASTTRQWLSRQQQQQSVLIDGVEGEGLRWRRRQRRRRRERPEGCVQYGVGGWEACRGLGGGGAGKRALLQADDKSGASSCLRYNTHAPVRIMYAMIA